MNLTRKSYVRWGVATAMTLIASCTSALAQDKTTLTFANWASAEGATKESIERLIAGFEAENPDIDVVSESISFSEIARLLVLRARSGNPPDVAQVAGNDTVLLASTGSLAPLDGYIDDALRQRIKPGALEGLSKDGKLVAFPWIQSPAGLWYNKRILVAAGLDPANPPATIDELTEALRAVHASQPDVIPIGLDTTNRAFALTSNWPWMRTFGAIPIGQDATGANSEGMKAYLSWMRLLAQEGLMDPGRKIGEFRPLAAQDKVAFHWDQVLLQGVVQSTNHISNEDFYDTWGVTTMPVGPSGKAFSFEGGHQLVMFEKSDKKDAAWKFMKYLATNPEGISDYMINVTSSLPPVLDAGDSSVDAQLDTPIFNAFTDKIIPTLSPQPYGADFAAASTAIMAGVQEAVTGNQPIDAIAQTIDGQLAK